METWRNMFRPLRGSSKKAETGRRDTRGRRMQRPGRRRDGRMSRIAGRKGRAARPRGRARAKDFPAIRRNSQNAQKEHRRPGACRAMPPDRRRGTRHSARRPCPSGGGSPTPSRGRQRRGIPRCSRGVSLGSSWIRGKRGGPYGRMGEGKKAGGRQGPSSGGYLKNVE